ncbi:MAG: class I SAM-dependent methyltransferase, partial [Anaerolineae bacterium]|nr:class I SAM-dependent methyltransferase [Anaerolineae bacterium]
PMMERLRAKRAGEPVYLALADATRLPFPDNTFDGAVAVHVFHLIPNWRDALREVARVLRPGAPLVHCFSDGHRHNPHTAALQQVWDDAVPQERTTRVGLRWEEHETFMTLEGWHEANIATYTYQNPITPQSILDYREQRQGSATWRLSDEDLNRGVEALKAYIAAHYPDPNQPIMIEERFQAMAYTPPGK